MTGRRALVQPVATGLLVVVTFVGTYLVLLLAPAPQDLRLAVVGTAAAPAGIEPAGIELVALPDAAAAERAVRERSVDGAYLSEPGTLLVASAAGAATVQALVATIDGVQVRDLAPLPPTDPRGLAGFYLVFGMVLAAFIFGQTNHLYSRALALRLRLAQTAVVAPAAGVLGALIAGPLVGATVAPFGAVALVSTMLVASVALVTQAATSALGDPGILVSTLLLLTLGNAAGGGAIPVPFLPDGLRQLAPLLPPGAAVRALQDASSFPLADPTGPYVVLLVWICGAALVLLATYHRAPGTGPVLARTLTSTSA